MDHTEFENALDACYEAVVAPETWPQALHRLALSVNASAAMIFPENIDSGAAAMPASLAYEALLPEYVAGNWFQDHYRAERGWALFPRQTVILEHDLATDEERRKLAHYNEFYLRWGYPGFAAVGFRVGDVNYALPFLRNVRQGDFSREEANAMAPLSAHFRRILTLSQRFSSVEAHAGIATLERMGCAALLVDRKGHVEACNAKAEALAKANGEALTLKAGYIASPHGPSNARLQTLIAQCCMPDVGASGTVNVSPVRIERFAQRPLVVSGITLRGIVNAISARSSAILLISDLEPSPLTDHDRMGGLFSLTPSEARVAAALKTGDSLQSTARDLSISYQTARTHLKSVFAKTGTSRQGELVALLASLA